MTLLSLRTAIDDRQEILLARSTQSVNGLTRNTDNWLETIPPEFNHFADMVFSNVREGDKLPACKIYDMNKEQLDTLKAIIDKQLTKGFIRPSSTSASSPVFFITDKASSSHSVSQMRLVMDYQNLNSKIYMDTYPIPPSRTVIERLPKAKIFMKFDVCAGFNNIQIKPGDEHKTAFKTFFGLYEDTVMPFGLPNAPSVFQWFINHVLAPFLEIFCFTYLDDIIIFSKNIKEHQKHVTQIFEALQANDLHLKPSKSVWKVDEVAFLGFTAIANKVIYMSDDKMEGLCNSSKIPRHHQLLPRLHSPLLRHRCPPYPAYWQGCPLGMEQCV